ncbi:60S ribosomal protein L23 [Conglomerata obtusa]
MAAGGKNKKDKKVCRQKMSRGVQVGTVLNCADNTGAKILKVIAAKGIQGRLNRLPSASPGDIVICTVKKGKPEMRKKVVPVVLIRQKMVWRRKEGMRICFEDNAGIVILPNGDIKGTQIAGAVPREVSEMWPKISSQASAII